MPIVIPDQKSVPVAEQEKLTIKDKRDYCFDALKTLRYYSSMNIHNQLAINDFRASVLDLYFFLKPKMKRHIIQLSESAKKENQEASEVWKELINFMEHYDNKTIIIPLKDIISLLDLMNQFCEEYGITNTQVKTMTSSDFE
jgi:hypothetical protein